MKLSSSTNAAEPGSTAHRAGPVRKQRMCVIVLVYEQWMRLLNSSTDAAEPGSTAHKAGPVHVACRGRVMCADQSKMCDLGSQRLSFNLSGKGLCIKVTERFEERTLET